MREGVLELIAAENLDIEEEGRHCGIVSMKMLEIECHELKQNTV